MAVEGNGGRHGWGGAHGMRSLWVASLMGALAQSLAGSAGTLLVARLGGTSISGLPQAILVLGTAVGALVIGRISQLIGRRPALAMGAGTGAIGSALLFVAALTGNLWMALAGCVPLGAGAAAVTLGRYAGADVSHEDHRGRAMATVLTLVTVGAVAGPNLLGPSAALSLMVGLPELSGAYALAAGAFASAVAALLVHRRPDEAFSPRGTETIERAFSWRREGTAGLAVLGIANLVMVGVMTMTPLHLLAIGGGLGSIGLVVSLHIAGMFGPSVVSGWMVDRIGARLTAIMGAAVLTGGCLLGMIAISPLWLTVAMAFLGVGWNLALIAGSALLTHGVPAALRPGREAWGEAGMGFAASSGGAASGFVMHDYGFGVLAAWGAIISATVLPACFPGPRQARSGD